MLKVLNKRRKIQDVGGTAQLEVGAVTASPCVWGSSFGSVIANMATLAVPKELDRLAEYTDNRATKKQPYDLETLTEKFAKSCKGVVSYTWIFASY